MPHKGNYGVDVDDEYDAYEDYDYDYDSDVQENSVEPPETEQETLRPGVWRCPICTFDNEETMSACDICGVLRNPLVNVHRNGNNNLAPFKFDVLSPDDLVSSGLRSSNVGSEAISRGSASSVTPSSVSRKKIAIDFPLDAKSINSSSIILSEDGHGSVAKDTHSPVNGDEPQSLSGSLNDMSLNIKSGVSKNVNAGLSRSHAHYEPEKWMLPNQAEDKLIQLNLAIVGHVDSGKSTLSGRLLHLLGWISQKQMHKYEKESKLQGKGSFAYAWALDESPEERERGITMTVAVAYFDSNRYHIVLLDAPGHMDFVPNMISGATQADAAVLVIDASMGSFEAGMDSTGGQTREHAQLIRSFGVDQVIVAINKMDAVQYSKERFDTIKLQLGTFLRQLGFKNSSVSWVPLSAIENQNLVVSASDGRLSFWYKGPSLLDAIDSLVPPARDYSKPLLMPICDVIKFQSQGQVSACGKLEAGALRSGSKVLVMPSREIATVRSLERDSQSCTIARAGDNVAVCLQGIDGSHVMAGGVLCHPEFPVALANHLELKILVLDCATPILVGSQLEFHVHHAKEAARIVKIISLLDPKTGKETKKAPRCLMVKQTAVIQVALPGTVCVAESSTYKALSRVFLRASGRTVAVGLVNRIIEQ